MSDTYDLLMHAEPPHAITQLGMSPPTPADRRFVLATRALIREADDWCRDTLGLPRRPGSGGLDPLYPAVPPTPVRRRTPPVSRRPSRRVKGLCVGCLCPHDDRTDGCPNCDARHGMRRLTRRGATLART